MIIKTQKLVKIILKKQLVKRKSIYSIRIEKILISRRFKKIKTVKICIVNLKFGDFKIFRSEKKPIKNIKNRNNLNVINSFGTKIKIVVIKNKPPENGGVIFLLIRFLCLKTFFLSFKKFI